MRPYKQQVLNRWLQPKKGQEMASLGGRHIRKFYNQKNYPNFGTLSLMLQAPVREVAWRLAQATAKSKVYGGGKPQYPLIARCYSSRVGDDSNPSVPLLNVENVARKAETHWRTKGWEEKLLAGLKAYKEKNVDLLVPYSFTVPLGDVSWPQAVWGYKLGTAVSNVRTQLNAVELTLSPQMIEELDRLGFVPDVSQYKWDHIVIPSLRQFRKLYGNLDVPFHFVVPEENEAWPKITWGKRLGRIVSEMRRRRSFVSQMAKSNEELEELGFCYNVAERDWTEKILPSFKVYVQDFGHCIITQKFKVPSCHPWPEKAWGMPLGKAVNDFRLGKTYVEQAARDKDILDALGFAWNRSGAVWNQQIIPGIRVYVEIFKNGKIPCKFVVPSEDPWPRSAWGTNLGWKLSDMRSKGAYFQYFGRDAEMLDELVINLKLSARAWHARVVPLLDIYARQHCGGADIPDDFVIPSEAPWPENMWGVRLGLIVARNFHLQ